MSSISPPAGQPAGAIETSRLPRPLTAFVGRCRELAEAERLLDGSRLLTLCGAGGSGKTRLAIEVARRASPRFPGGVAWVDLAALEDQRLVSQQTALALGIRDEGSGEPTDAIVGVLRHRTVLLVLDNCEHVVDAASTLAETLLRECAGLTILGTSREPLTLAGERAWLVPPLSLPSADVPADTAEASSEALQLFVARARDVLPSFAVTPANVAAVADICRRLDGIPLALELAAARVRALGPEQIARRLDDAFRLLTTSGRGALPRHRTLRATMDWSARLLTPAKQALLRRLGAFAGGFTLEAVEAVCAGGEVPPDDVLDLLAGLVDRSMVAVREQDAAVRYHLLETVRQYALEQLVNAGEEPALRAAHTAYFAGLAAQAEPLLTTVARREGIERLDAELDNLRQALRWSREHDGALHVRLAGQLCWYWFSSRHWAEGRRWLEGALQLPAAAVPGPERGAALFATGVLATLQGDPALARLVLEESVALASARADGRAEAYGNVYLGMAIASTGAREGRELCARAGAWFREAGELYGLRLAELIQSTFALSAGDVPAAIRHAEEGVRIARAFGQEREIAISLQSLANAVIVAGDEGRAVGLVQESIARLRRDPSFLFLARGLEYLALVSCVRTQWAEGVILFAAAEAARETIGARQFPIDVQRYAPHLARARAALGDEAFESARAAGRALPLDAAVERALALRSDAELASPVERPEATPPAPAEALHVRALGPLEIHVDGRNLGDDAWRSSRPRELFLYFLLHREGRTREQIGLAFWPDASPAQLRNNFHVTLHHVRKALGRADAVVIERERYRINPALGTWCDVTVFEGRAGDALRRARAGDDARAALTEALAIYRGDLLEGLMPGDWHLEMHDRMKRLAAECASALARGHLAAGDTWAAIPVLERLVALDELHEEGHRLLLEAYAATGARARAIQHYRNLAAWLKRELDTQPEPRTTSLYQRILESDAG